MGAGTFTELLEEIKDIPKFESRIDDPDLKEFVIQSDYIMPMHVKFQEFFGEDFKSANQEPTFEDKRRAARWGGVRGCQALYFVEKEGVSNCAMFWPWRDGTRCTVKIIRW